MFPHSLIDALRGRLAKRRMRTYSKLTAEQAFDRIYERGTWSNGGQELSGGGSYGEVAEKYIEYVAGFIEAHEIKTILDVGCGDFNIGARIAAHAERYYAVDVSGKIIALNRSRYAALSNVEFHQADACLDALVKTDLLTVRQVLQHLTNNQIEMILRNIERTAPRYVLIAEHLGDQTGSFRPNLDLPNHSADTRVVIGSGVVLNAPPFSRAAELVAEIPLAAEQRRSAAVPEALGVFLLRLGNP